MRILFTIFRKICDKLKELWNFYGGIALSTLIAWWTDWSKSSIDTWASYITLTLVCIGVLTYLKMHHFQKTKADSVAMATNKQIKNINEVMNVDRTGEELGQTIIYSVKEGKKLITKIKKIIKWLWGNKLTLTSIISNLVISVMAQFIMYSDTLEDISFFQEHDIVFKIVVSVLCALWLINNIYTAVTKYGLESLEELAQKAEELADSTTAQLTSDQLKTLKAQLKTLSTKKAEIESAITEVKSVIETAQKIISDYNLLTSLGITVTSEQTAEYKTATQTVASSTAELTTLNNNLTAVETQITQIEEAI